MPCPSMMVQHSGQLFKSVMLVLLECFLYQIFVVFMSIFIDYKCNREAMSVTCSHVGNAIL